MNINKLIQLKPEEEILMTVHQTLIPILPKVILGFVWLVLPFFLLFPLVKLGVAGTVIFLVMILSGMFFSFRLHFIWKRSIFIVTDKRIIDIDQRGLFSRVVSEAVYGVVEDVSYSIKGIVPTICRYGSILIQTAGSTVDLQVFHVHKPRRVHDLLNDLRHAARDHVHEEIDIQLEEQLEIEAKAEAEAEVEAEREEAVSEFFKAHIET